MKRLTLGLTLCIAIVATGCDGANNPLVEVNGKIQFTDGTNLPAGTTLRFDPSQGDRRISTAEVAGDGSFTLQHASGADGIELGNYSIALLPPKGDADGFERVVPDKYIDSGALTAEIKEGMGPLELKVEKRPAGKKRG